MNLLEILGVKPTNGLPIVYGAMKYVPAFLHSDEVTTQELNEEIYKYFPYDLVRIGQMHGFNDLAAYTNSNQCLQLRVTVKYDEGIIKATLCRFDDDIARASVHFTKVDPRDEIGDHKEQLILCIATLMESLGNNMSKRLNYEKQIPIN